MDGTGFGRIVHNASSAQVTGALGGLYMFLMVGVHLLVGVFAVLGDRKAFGCAAVGFLGGAGVFGFGIDVQAKDAVVRAVTSVGTL